MDEAADDREAERGGLLRSVLRARYEVPPDMGDGERLLLHRHGAVVATPHHAPEHGLRQPSHLKRVWRWRHAVPAHLHRDLVLVQPPITDPGTVRQVAAEEGIQRMVKTVGLGGGHGGEEMS
jgi:hypothetical protein